MAETRFDTRDKYLYEFFSAEKETFLEVPHYQRGYSWSEKNYEDFWQDLESVRESGDEYFFGNIIVLQEESGKLSKYKLVDGQQRMATSSIFLTVIRDLYMKINSSLFEEVEKELFNSKRTPSDQYYYKIQLDIDDNQFLKDVIFAKVGSLITDKYEYVKKSKTIYKTNKNLKNCYLYFYDLILKEIDSKAKIEQENYLNDLRSTLRTDFVITRTIVEETNEAYTLFDRVNNRGKKLSNSDLIKDFLFSLIEDDVTHGRSVITMKDAEKYWNDLFKKFKRDTSLLNDFLHSYLNAHHTTIVEKDEKTLEVVKKYQMVNKLKGYQKFTEITKNISAAELLKDISLKSEIYQILKIEPKLDSQISNITKQNLLWLNGLGVKIVYPILMAGYEKYTKNDFEKLTSYCLKYMFRAKTIARVNPSTLEKELGHLAFEIRENSTNVEVIRENLQKSSNNPTDASFFERMKIISFSSPSHATYALCQIIEYEQSKRITDVVPSQSCEHIMPQDISKWKEYIKNNNSLKYDEEIKEFVDKYLERLGNLTIISLPKNTGQSNKPYDEKKVKYGLSLIEMTKELSSLEIYKIWNADAINKRQEKMAEKAIKIWKL